MWRALIRHPTYFASSPPCCHKVSPRGQSLWLGDLLANHLSLHVFLIYTFLFADRAGSTDRVMLLAGYIQPSHGGAVSWVEKGYLRWKTYVPWQ